METALGGPEALERAINKKEVYSKVVDGVEFFFRPHNYCRKANGDERGL